MSGSVASSWFNLTKRNATLICYPFKASAQGRSSSLETAGSPRYHFPSKDGHPVWARLVVLRWALPERCHLVSSGKDDDSQNAREPPAPDAPFSPVAVVKTSPQPGAPNCFGRVFEDHQCLYCSFTHSIQLNDCYTTVY